LLCCRMSSRNHEKNPLTSTDLKPQAHVVVLANEKGGSGKSTLAFLFTIGLLGLGQRVATIDLDGRQKTLTHFIENRSAWSKKSGLDLELPLHSCVDLGGSLQIQRNEFLEKSQLIQALSVVEQNVDFIIVDTPGSNSFLMCLAHLIADTIVTPLNDSFLDFDVLGTVDPATYDVTGRSHYSELVQMMRRERQRLDETAIQWFVVRNRLAMHASSNKRQIARVLGKLSRELGFRWTDGLCERTIYREYFPYGVTVFDDLDGANLNRGPIVGLQTARDEVTKLLSGLRLPVNEVRRSVATYRSEWLQRSAAEFEALFA
jgi:chromosome partitioning protein